MDNFYQALPFALAVLCRDQNPRTFAELAQMADKFDCARDRTFTSNKGVVAKPWKAHQEHSKLNFLKPNHGGNNFPPPRVPCRDNRDYSAPPRFSDFKPPSKLMANQTRQNNDRSWRPNQDKLNYQSNWKPVSQWNDRPNYQAPQSHTSRFVDQARPPRQDTREWWPSK